MAQESETNGNEPWLFLSGRQRFNEPVQNPIKKCPRCDSHNIIETTCSRTVGISIKCLNCEHLPDY